MDAEGIGTVAAAAIAAVALVIAWLARRDSRRSAQAAERSADASDRSAVASERAAVVSELEARRRVERSDVAWERVKVENGLVRYRNVGSHDAFGVTVLLTINDERITLSPGVVPSGAHFEHDARGIYQAERRRAAVRREQASRRPGVVTITTTRFRVGARISWETELGNAGIVTL